MDEFAGDLEGLAEDLEEEVDEEDREADVEPPAPRPAPQAPPAPARRSLPGLFNPDADDDADDREWSVVLLDGQEVRGPFFRPDPDGAPMLEVNAVVRRGRSVTRGAHRGRIRHDADETDLLRQFGPGRYYVWVRDPSGQALAGNSVSVGDLRAAEAVEKSAEAKGGELTELAKLFVQQGERMAAFMETQARELQALRVEQAERAHEEEREARRRDQERLEGVLERLSEQRAGPSQGAPGVGDVIAVLSRHLEERRQADELLERLGAGRVGPEDEAGIMGAAAAKVEEWASMAGGLAKVFGGGDGNDD